MPRGPRLDAEGALHHVMVRGIEKRDIFLSDDDREDLLARLAVLVPASGVAVYAWSLMPNHFHLLLRSGSSGLSTFMRRLQTGYAVAFNRRHRRAGHLFQNRFRSVLVEEEPCFLDLVRYLHLNPLRAEVVRSMRGLDTYPWSGHAVLLGNRESLWQDVGEVLGRFGEDAVQAQSTYRQFVAEGVEQGRRSELNGGGLIRSIGGREKIEEFRRGRERWMSDERVLGSGEFVKQVIAAAEQRMLPRVRPEVQEDVLKDLLGSLATRLGVEVREVFGLGRRQEVSRVRAVFSYLAVVKLGVPLTAVAHFLHVTVPAVKLALPRGSQRFNELGIEVEGLVEKYIRSTQSGGQRTKVLQ
jgi:putative transposase